MLARNNASSSCQWIKEWMGFTVKTTCWETSSVLIKELDHYLDQGSSDVWYTIEISKFASSLNTTVNRMHENPSVYEGSYRMQLLACQV
ncbi:hypothetical protein Peur_046031 [Populus x canadensis]